MSSITKFIEAAIFAAGKAEPRMRWRHGAVLADARGKIISTGFNYFTQQFPWTNVVKTEHYISAHAEYSCVMKMSRSTLKLQKGLTMYVVGIQKNGCMVTSSRPCSKCEAFMRNNNIAKVIFMENDKIITINLQ